MAEREREREEIDISPVRARLAEIEGEDGKWSFMGTVKPTEEKQPSQSTCKYEFISAQLFTR